MWPIGVIVALAVLGVILLVWLVGERGRLLGRSTRRIIRECGFWPFFGPRGVHGYFYARWPRQYIGLFVNHLFPRMGRRAKKWLSDHYHGKVLTAEHAKAVITVNREIPLQDLEQIIPYPAARSLMLAGPPDVAVFECPCRWVRPDPCLPTQVCMIIGQPFVDFLLEHHPAKSRRLAQAEALELLEAEHRRGHLHAAWFKDVCLDRFFAICNCCKCCCGGIDAMVNHGIPMMTSSGYVARVDPSRCQACGKCQAACPFQAIHVDDKAAVDWEACLGCGVCEGQCPQGAVSLVRDPNKGVPLDVRLLAQREVRGPAG
jgi:ferredoxin